MASSSAEEYELHIRQYRMKKLIKNLESARGNGTSMISLILPPGEQISKAAKMLSDEYGTASNIKSRVNRQSVLDAITSVQQRLKLYNKTPPNGLVLYCGTVITDEGKEKKVTYDFEPYSPINTSLYLCDNKFHTEPLGELLQSDSKYGFIIMDGNGTLYGTLCGNTREILHKFSVELPKKHGRGGQSSVRFARLRLEKRHNYLRRVAEMAVQMFITNDRPNVAGLVLAGSADFKTELAQSDLFDPRLQAVVITSVDVAYGGENGFNQAIELSADSLADVKFVQEKRLIDRFMEEISNDTNKYVFGLDDSLKALESGAVSTLIVWENFEVMRYTFRNSSTGDEIVKHLTPAQEHDEKYFVDKESGVHLEAIEKESFTDWIAVAYKTFGCQLEFVTNCSQEGAQFCRGFGGIGGILRFPIDFQQLAEDELGGDDDSDWDPEDFM